VFTLYTCNYAHFTPAMGTAIQTSRGAPRWPLRYALDVKISELMPARWTLDLPYDVFADRYRDQLDEVGVDHLAARFQAIASATGEPRLVLLCFENLAKPGLWCHREMFSEFWSSRTGHQVLELGPVRMAGPAPVEDGGGGSGDGRA
jgi:hypothetical protein